MPFDPVTKKFDPSSLCLFSRGELPQDLRVNPVVEVLVVFHPWHQTQGGFIVCHPEARIGAVIVAVPHVVGGPLFWLSVAGWVQAAIVRSQVQLLVAEKQINCRLHVPGVVQLGLLKTILNALEYVGRPGTLVVGGF